MRGYLVFAPLVSLRTNSSSPAHLIGISLTRRLMDVGKDQLRRQRTGRAMPTKMFRADQLGSLLRPDHLIEAREAFNAGRIDAKSLGNIEDQAVFQALEAQKNRGIDVFVDGEFRRTGFMTNLADSVGL